MISTKQYLAALMVAALIVTQIPVPYVVHAEEESSDTEVSEETTSDSEISESTEPELDESADEETETDTTNIEMTTEDDGAGEEESLEEPEKNTGSEDEEIVEKGEDEMIENEDEVNDETEEGGEDALESSEIIPDDAVTTEASSSVEIPLNASSSDAALEEVSLLATTTTDTATSTVEASDPTITSGTAVALANILNLVNTNFINSDGVVLFSNLFESLFGTIDFRSYFNAMLGTSTCSLAGCTDEQVMVNLQNDATIQNALLLQALSGGNTIEADGGNATIDSGNAYAGANIINVANTNLVDSNYLLVTLNAFEDVNGDIVFPSLSQFFNNLRGGASPESIEVTNAAGVENNVNLEADSGNNTADDNDSSHTETGDAHTSTNVFNEINTSLVGGESISVIFRVHGNWAGEIFGAPDDLGWITGDDGSLYLFDREGQGSAEANRGNLSVDANNDALISNNVSVVALTGDNHITGADTALISTGNAYAGANIINVANANIVGRNWILAIINIFGDFNGNIAFGRPDLWIGEQVEVPNDIENGSEVTYKMTVINNGDSEASNVTLTDEYDASHIEIIESSLPYTQEGDTLTWELEDLPAGSAVEVSYKAAIHSAGYDTDITNIVSVSGRETDNNVEDNSDTVTIRTDGRSNRNRILRIPKEEVIELTQIKEQGIDIERTSADTVLKAGTRASVQSLVIRNTTDTLAKGVIFHDILTSPNGTVIQDEVWEFGDILPNEEIQIGYTITFDDSAAPGRYALSSSLTGANLSTHSESNGFIELEALLTAIPDPEPEIAGASTSTSLAMTDRPSPLRPEDSSNDFISPFIPQAYAAENETDLRDDSNISAYMPYLATIIISIILIVGTLVRRIRQNAETE